jgi:hypothetical protein
MSDVGLYEGFYEYLKRYADQLDQNLVQLRSEDVRLNDHARKELVTLIRQLSEDKQDSPWIQLVAMMLRRHLDRQSEGGIGRLKELAESLEIRYPNQSDLNRLEEVAALIDRECARVLGRTK